MTSNLSWSDGTRAACYSGNLEIFEFVYEKFKLVDLSQRCGESVLLLNAVKGKNIKIMEILRRGGAVLLTETIAIGFATGDLDIFNWFQKNFDIPNTYNLLDDHLLCAACRGGHLDLINYVISYGNRNWNHGLEGACFGGHVDIALLMIKYGASDFNSGLKVACLKNHQNLAVFMIKSGATDFNGGLSEASLYDHRSIIDLMLNFGADPNSGLFAACEGRHLALVKYLIQKGANNFTDGILSICWTGGRKIAEFLFTQGIIDFDQILDSFIGQNCKPDIVKNAFNGDTNLALSYACQHQQNNFIRFNILRGATRCTCGKSVALHV